MCGTSCRWLSTERSSVQRSEERNVRSGGQAAVGEKPVDGGVESRVGYVFHYNCIADAFGKDEAPGSGAIFFVAAGGGEEFGGRGAEGGQRPGGGEGFLVSVGGGGTTGFGARAI